MQPTTMPTTVNARNVVTARSRLHEVVVAVAPVARRRIRSAHELPTLDVGDDVAGPRSFAGRIARLEYPVRVALVDVFQRRDQGGPLGLGAGRLQGLHEHTGRRLAVHAEQVGVGARVRL